MPNLKRFRVNCLRLLGSLRLPIGERHLKRGVMSENTPAPCSRDACFKCLFEENVDGLSDVPDRATAFAILANYYAKDWEKLHPEDAGLWANIQLDFRALQMMIGRFLRDAFGIKHFGEYLSGLQSSGEIKEPVRLEIEHRVKNLPLRINSDSPFKTRIAAVFSLWMCAFRPISIDLESGKEGAQYDQFCALFNLWLAQNYLSYYGAVEIGDKNTREDMVKRIRYDFTYRDVNLSSLEMLYCGMFTANSDESLTPPHIAMVGRAVAIPKLSK